MSTYNYPVFGVVFGGSGTFTSGILPRTRRTADNSVEIEKYTVDGTTSGDLSWQAVRAIDGIHCSVSEKQQAPSSPNASRTVTEEKIFFLASDRNKSSGFADWNIFSVYGEPVTATSGTTRIDVTPSGTFNNTVGESPV